MNYKEMTYKEKSAFEKTLTTSQRSKLRKMEQEHKDVLQPINWASNKREEEVRIQAWKNLKIQERLEALEAENAPKRQELKEKIDALNAELRELNDKINEARTNIQVEAYQAASNDPEVKTLNAVWRQIKEAQELKFQQLINSLTKVNA
jgi:uncharacterized protein YPO0396